MAKLAGNSREMQRQIGEELLPAIRKSAEAVSFFAKELERIDPNWRDWSDETWDEFEAANDEA